MRVKLIWRGCLLKEEDCHQYTVQCANGEVFEFFDDVYYKTGTRLDFPDDWCQQDSGWVHWLCDVCHQDYWTRSRPTAIIKCPICGTEEIIPADAKMLESEGVEDEYTEYYS